MSAKKERINAVMDKAERALISNLLNVAMAESDVAAILNYLFELTNWDVLRVDLTKLKDSKYQVKIRMDHHVPRSKNGQISVGNFKEVKYDRYVTVCGKLQKID